MKKVLGISLVAVLAVSPMMAFAADPAGAPTHDENPTIIEAGPAFALVPENSETDGNAASAGYVKGAYNAAIMAINKVNENTKTSAGDGLTKSGNTISASLTSNGGLQFDGEGNNPKTLGVKTGNGLQKDGTNGTITVKAGNGVAVDSNGVKVVAEDNKGLTVGANGVAVVTGNGIAVDSNGVKVVAESNKGIVVGASGVAVDYDTGSMGINATSNKLEVKDGGITTAKIASANVTADKLSTDAVETEKIKNSAVTTDKIANGNVTFTKVAGTDVIDSTEGIAAAASASDSKFVTEKAVATELKNGIEKTLLHGTTLTSTASNFELTSGTVTGSVVIPIMDNWSSPDTVNTTGITTSNVSLAVSNRAVTGDVATTVATAAFTDVTPVTPSTTE